MLTDFTWQVKLGIILIMVVIWQLYLSNYLYFQYIIFRSINFFFMANKYIIYKKMRMDIHGLRGTFPKSSTGKLKTTMQY